MGIVRAVEQIRKMNGGAQSHLMRCSDDNYYVVKFQNNPQHRRVLVNEMFGTRLAGMLGLPTATMNVVDVSEELIRLTPELSIETPRTRIPCVHGRQFGSRYSADPRVVTPHDFLPDEELCRVDNLHEFAGMLVFDKWTCNTDGRQTVFLEISPQNQSVGLLDPPLGLRGATKRYRTVMIDQGFCFNAGYWNFPDAPLRGLYARNRVYQAVVGMESFGAWLQRLEQITEAKMHELTLEIPPEWFDSDYEAMARLVERLYRRRRRVPELLLAAKNSNRCPFPQWIQDRQDSSCLLPSGHLMIGTHVS